MRSRRFLGLEGALAVAAVGVAVVLGWPSPEPEERDGRGDAWHQSLTATPDEGAHAPLDAGPAGGAAGPVTLSSSAKERLAAPRYMARLAHTAPTTIVPEEGLPSLPVDAAEQLEAAPAAATAGLAPVPREGPSATTPPWLRHAVATPAVNGRPLVAVIVDDLGLGRRLTAEVIDLPAPLTLAFLPYARNLAEQTAAARDAGHELLLHMPMEPVGFVDPGPHALVTSLPEDEFRRRLRLNLTSFDGYVGVNNHMGSRATADRDKMALVMDELRAEGLLFVDSRTTPFSVAGAEAGRHGVPNAGRDVFLDNVPEPDHIRDQLRRVEAIAQSSGAAIAIGHPYPPTIRALRAWLPTLEARGFTVVPVSAVVAQRVCRDGTLPAACRAYALLQTAVN